MLFRSPGIQRHFYHNEHLQPRVTLCGERGSTEDQSPGLRSWISAGSNKACKCSFGDNGRQVVVQTGDNTRLCQSIEARSVDITRLQVPPSRNKPLCFLEKGSTGVFFVLLRPFASVCKHSYPFPSPWSAARRQQNGYFAKSCVKRSRKPSAMP